MAPLVGLISLLCGLWFLFGMPALVAVFAWRDRRCGKVSTGLLVATVTTVVFYLCAGLIWRWMIPDWNLSFLETLDASVNSEKYGHPVEHRAENMLVFLLLVSTLAAAAAGAAIATGRRLWIRRCHEVLVPVPGRKPLHRSHPKNLGRRMRQ